MATITPALGAVITPLLVLEYGFTRASRDVILEPLGSKYPTVFLRESQSKAGTLTLLFAGNAAATSAEETLGSVNRFHFEEPAAGQDFHFVKAGAITVTKIEGVDYWTVAVEFREVEPA
jgi:hypothetical protein